jgi:hypothetical protein
VAEVLGNRLAVLQRPQLQTDPKPSEPPSKDRPATRTRIKRMLLGATTLIIVALAWAGRPSLVEVNSALRPPGPQARKPALAAPAGPLPGGVGEAGPQAEGAEPDVIVGSGKPETREVKLADFASVEVRYPFQVEIKHAGGFGVTLTADDNVLKHVKADKVGRALEITLEEGKTYRLKRGSLKVEVSMPTLESIGLSHGARGTILGFRSDRSFTAETSHGSRLDGEIEFGDVSLSASHGSTLALKGKARAAKLDVSHGSTMRLSELACGSLDADVAHGATAFINSRSAEKFHADVAHGATLSGSVEAKDIMVDAQHGASVFLEGTGQSARLSAGFGGRLAFGALALDRAEVELAHAGSATVNAKDALDYELTFGSTLRYVGTPKIGRAEAARDSHARPIEASAAVREKPAAPREPRHHAESGHGEMVITTRGACTNMIHIGDHYARAIIGSGKPATRQVEVSGFQSVHASLPCFVEIVRDNAFHVNFTADDNMVEHLTAVKVGETLRLELKQGSYQPRTRITARVGMPSIAALDLDGAVHARIEGFESDHPFHAKIDGASRLEGSIKAGEVVVDCDGAGRAALRGAATAIKVKADGASHVDLGDMTAGSADVQLSGASHATINAREQLSYATRGVSHLEYIGDPKIPAAKKDRMSSVRRR